MYDVKRAVRARRERQKAEGICIACGKRPARPGRVMCQECTDRQAASQKARREKLRAEGICTACGKRPARPGKAHCAWCAEKWTPYGRPAGVQCSGDCLNCELPECTAGDAPAQSYTEARQARLRAAGLCWRCGKRPVQPGTRSCAECSRIQSRDAKARREERERAGVCPRCGMRPPAPGKKACAVCLDAQNAARRELRMKRIDAGLCVRCGKEPARPGLLSCPACGAKGTERARRARADRMRKGPGGPQEGGRP